MTLPLLFDAPDETPLTRSPLATVVWQLRIDDQPALTQPKNVLRIQESLADTEAFSLSKLPRVQVLAQVGNPGEGGQVASPPSVVGAGGGWRLSAQDGSWHVNIEQASISVETSAYGTWNEQFRPKLERVLNALAEVGPPVIEVRLGLRYINLIFGGALDRDPFDRVADFEGVLEPAILGVIANPELREYAEVVQGRYSLNLADMKAIVNYGVVTAENGELGYLLDIDAFRDGARPYSQEDVLAAATDLHRISLTLFRYSLSEETAHRMTEAAPSSFPRPSVD